MADDSTDSAESTDSARLEEVSSQLREAEDRYLRMRADLDNIKKRSAQQQLEARKYAASELASRLLPVLDDAERALEHVPEGTDETWLQGIRLTVQKLRDVLSSLGVEPMEAMGEPFDPERHEAVGSEESPEHPEGTVMRELRRGYRLHDRVLRPSLVKLSRRSE
jgi:molecular chaperone GrpE